MNHLAYAVRLAVVSGACSWKDDAVILGLEPLDAILLVELVGEANLALPQLAACHAASRAAKMDEEVHAVDAGAWVVLDAKIDVLRDTETEAAVLAKVAFAQLVLLDLQALLDNLHGLLAAHGHVASDLLVTADAERTDGDASLGEHGRLLRELLEHLGGAREAVTTLADANVEHELLDADLPHGILGFVRHVAIWMFEGCHKPVCLHSRMLT